MSSNHTGRVLVLGDDMRIFLSVCRALGRAGKTVHAVPFDTTSPALKSRYVKAVHKVPDFAEHPAEWLAGIRSLASRFSFDLIIPCTDPAIIALDRNREALADQCLAIPPALSMDFFFDKETTHETCMQIGVPVLQASRLDHSGTPAAIIAKYGLPVVIKPRRSFWQDQLNVKDKVHIIEDAAQLHAVHASLINPSRYLVEQYFEGQGVGVSVLAAGGKILQAFQHRRLREGKGGSSSYRISEMLDDSMLEACDKVCRHTRHTGVCMFEFRRNPDTGDMVLLETNSRFWGSMPLPTAIGVDFPNALYDLLVLAKQRPAMTYKAGVRSRNLVLDAYNIYKQAREATLRSVPGLASDAIDFLLQPVRWIAGTELSDSFVSDDLAPAVAEFVQLPRQLMQKIHSGGNAGPVGGIGKSFAK